MGEGSSLGPSPGEGGASLNSPGSQENTLGGRAGTSAPRIVPNESAPRGFGRRARPEVQPITPIADPDIPIFGPLSLPSSRNEPVPGGLTLDDAIERLVRHNRELRAKFLELPQARADVLTASLRANPILYADSQLIPYGSYSKQRAGGPTQYDVNITWPLDVTGKRKSRTVVAHQILHVLEAQYQDAVRLQIGNLYMAYVDAIAARETVLYSQTAVAGLDQVEEIAKTRLKAKVTTPAEVNRLVIQREAAAAELAQAKLARIEAHRTLDILLDMPPDEPEDLKIAGSLAGPTATAPEVDSLIQLALTSRPDLNAFKLGVRRAEADVRLARAERLSDLYLLAQPYTFQDNRPFGTQSAHSWAMGITVPLPLFNRNQGNIERAKINVGQSQIELSAMEQRVVADVRRAHGQFNLTRDSLVKYERDMLPAASQVLDEAMRLYRGGEADFGTFLNARRDYNEAIRLYLDTLIRHRRSQLNLNTVVGCRILP
ncbi:MAG: hypothetical protein ABS79_02595 [Planctomycetes bacterium SCN 63-9]|nr:MAG: hypothetical protein ABS79_02595 [Planctomycetes bacterium SCN 63-9]